MTIYRFNFYETGLEMLANNEKLKQRNQRNRLDLWFATLHLDS